MPIHIDIHPKPFITIRLASGIQITTTSLLMHATYEGLLEGMPNDRFTERRLLSLEGRCQSILGPCPVHVIPPKITRFERPGSFGGVPRMAALLPPCEFFAVFESRKAMEWRNLAIVWHQASAKPLMTPEVRAQVAQLDWDALAEEVEI